MTLLIVSFQLTYLISNWTEGKSKADGDSEDRNEEDENDIDNTGTDGGAIGKAEDIDDDGDVNISFILY